ncbi:GBF-interacting protein 1 isoform X2 [Fagus crenata]
MSGSGSRVSIPSNMKKTIQNIKEITGNHTEDEIYAMLKECSMDPNETAQKLLLQDTFHEVKKRDRRKENQNNKESAESRWRPGTQGRGGRGGRGNVAPRHMSHDAGGGRNSGPGKENGINQAAEKVVTPTLPTSQDTKTKDQSLETSSAPVIANGPTGGPEVSSSSVSINNSGTAPPPAIANKNSVITFGTGDSHGQPTPSSSNRSASSSSSAVCFSSLDPVLVPSNDPRLPGVVGAIKREVGSNRPLGEPNTVVLAEKKITAAAETSSTIQGKMSSKSLGVGKNQLAESSQPSTTLTHSGSSVSRPSSNYNSRPQQIIGPQKVGSNKEWKPKPTNFNVVQDSGTAGASEVLTISVEATAQTQHEPSVLGMEEATSKLQRKLEVLHLPQRQLVILPNHIHVPESERSKLSFGSFGASFGVTTSYVSGPESDKSSTPLSETSQGIEETVEEEASSNQNALETAEEADYIDHPQSPTRVPENLSSGDGDVSSSAIPEYNESKQDTALPSGGHQYSVVHTSPNYNFGFVPPVMGSQLAPVENSESQARDVSRLPSFIVQQPFDPSYYAQFYRSGADSEGRLSPFPSPGVANKYNGNVAVLPPPSSQSPQEGGVLSTAGPTSLATQAAGPMQNSIAVTQQQVPLFRPAAGVHISHYPPNYIPYGHYFSPFYVPPPAIHQYLGNSAFPQQPPAGSVYPAPPPAAPTGVKYSLPQYKPGTNTGNPAHMGMPSGYGPYGSPPAGYNPSSAATAGNSTSNEDLTVSQFKENNVYISGQQSEGSAVWVAAPGRDMSSLPTSSFYNLPPQGQHVTFTPTQGGHGTFAGVYHPAQAVTAAMVHPLLQQSQTMAGAVDMVGPGGNVYQQTQQAQINWPSNY